MSSQGQEKQQHVKSRAEEAAAQTIALTPPSPLRSLSASAAGALLQQTRSPVANSASSTKRRAKRHNEHDRGTSRLRREDKSTAENKEPLRQRQVLTLIRPGSTDKLPHIPVAAALAPGAGLRQGRCCNRPGRLLQTQRVAQNEELNVTMNTTEAQADSGEKTRVQLRTKSRYANVKYRH